MYGANLENFTKTGHVTIVYFHLQLYELPLCKKYVNKVVALLTLGAHAQRGLL